VLGPRHQRSFCLHPISAQRACDDLANAVRKYHLPDFSNRKNPDTFETAFAKLEKDLRASILQETT
jgi:hypothetical protein